MKTCRVPKTLIIKNIKYEELKNIIENSKSYAQVFRNLNINGGGSNIERLKERLNKDNINYEHILNNANNYKEKDLIGKKFGKLTVIRLNMDSVHKAWFCKCDCGVEKSILQSHLIRGNSQSCGCSWNLYGLSHKSWKGCGEIHKNRFTQIKSGAIKRNIEFDITIEYIWNLFMEQGKKCALSGMDIDFSKKTMEHGKKIRQGTASLDRIDNTKGYIVGNVWWIHRDINWMKNTFEINYFLRVFQAHN